MPAFVFQNGPREGECVPIGASGTLLLGCLESCSLYVPDEHVIARHAQLKEHQGRYFIKDFARDTHINDALITTGEIRVGDLLRVGGTRLRFVSDADAPRLAAAATPSETQPTRVGRIVGGYEILQQLGRGGMGTVYRARQMSLDREVALKVLSPRLTRDEKFVEQFVREARAAGQLNHPNIVQVFDVGRDADLFFYSMEFMPSGTVADRLESQGRLSVTEALEIVANAARALEYAELKHIVHRDVKPGNLMIDELGHIKVADLGLALSLRDTAARDPQGILGTPHFISPEQAQRKDVDIRSDIYSLGATFYMLLAGHPPFQGRNAREIILKQVREEPPPLREIRSDVPERIADLIARMMRKNPEERPQSGAELVAELTAFGQHRGRKTLLLASTALIVVAATVVGAIIHFSQPEPEVIIKETRTGVDPDLLVKERSRAEQLAAELEAREALTRLDQTGGGAGAQLVGAERARALRDLAARYPGTKAAEEATTEARQISAALARERESRQRLEAERTRILTTAKDAVDAALQDGRLIDALRAAARIGLDTELALDPAVVETRGELSARAKAAVLSAAHDLVTAADEQIENGDFRAAETRLRALADLGNLPAAGAETSSLPPDIAAIFSGIAADAETRLAALDQARIARRAADRSHDRQLVADVLRRCAFGDALVNLRFDAVARTLSAAAAEPRTPGYRDFLQRWGRRFERLAGLQERLVRAVRDGKLTTDQIQPPGETREGRIIGLADDAGGLRIEYAVSGGRVAQNVPWNQLSRERGLVDLYEGLLGLKGAELADVGEAVILVEETRWLERLAPLFALLDAYDPATGWGQAQWARLADLDAAPPDFQVARSLLDRALGTAPQAPELAALGTLLDQEGDAVGLLSRALIPYISEKAIVGFVESAELLADLLQGNAASDLVALAYDHLDDGSAAIALVEEAR